MPAVDFSGFLSGLISSAVAGALVLYIGYRWVEERLRLQDASDRRRELEMRSDANRTAVLRAVHSELESAAAWLQMLLEQLPTGAVPSPGFDLAALPLVSQAAIFTTLRVETSQALRYAYNRMATANEQLAFLSDLNHGATALVVTALAAGRRSHPEVAAAYKMFEAHRATIRSGLVERLKDLKSYLDAAIDRVEEDTKQTREVPAAQRDYRPAEPPRFMDEITP